MPTALFGEARRKIKDDFIPERFVEMIGYIEGRLAETFERSCLVVTAGGVGYEIYTPASVLENLPARGETVSFFVTLVVREDALELYGFPTLAERRVFEILIGISKVGARTALAVLSLYGPADLRRVVDEGDETALMKVPGIGQKTGQHIFLELKYKLASIPGSVARSKSAAPAGVYSDAIGAMKNLGYEEEECAPIIREILKEEPDLDAGGVIRLALKTLAKGKF